ncbi:MAG TPA: TIGR03885 family FMN-dependent LLM class oxidoreductase [Pseudorhizobium sp.]|jgi:probable non-F420 flavinoid oxidoreductase|nr:TIGR03885 family FMN-dependent LLM class oxidoreductase [Pseudorhizobium sp.]
MIIGYHASHEQFAPSALLTYVKAAEEAGFQAIMTSDHIAPWSIRQSNSGSNWAWLGAAMAGTSLPFGTLAIPGGWRYHPSVLAHLVATLSEMFPGRLPWIAVGSGEALNERVVGKKWPEKEERNRRLQAGAEIMRALLNGEEVTVDDPDIATVGARLWSLPAAGPALFGAALSESTAGWMGTWADGLITVPKPKPKLENILRAFGDNGGKGKPLALQLQVAWAGSKQEARVAAWDQWRHLAAPTRTLAQFERPEDFDASVRDVRPEEMDDLIPLIDRADALVQIIRDYASLGFSEIYIHNVSRDQLGFIRFMEREVLPALHQR